MSTRRLGELTLLALVRRGIIAGPIPKGLGLAGEARTREHRSEVVVQYLQLKEWPHGGVEVEQTQRRRERRRHHEHATVPQQQDQHRRERHEQLAEGPTRVEANQVKNDLPQYLVRTRMVSTRKTSA